MKLVVDYDVLESIMNVNEGITPMKIIRNEKRDWIKFNLPIYSIINFSLNKPSVAFMILGLQFGFLVLANTLVYKIINYDKFKDKSELRLKLLAIDLNDLGVNTSYELLKESSNDGRKYKVQINKNKLPELVETKYILVPTYTNMGDIKDTSIEQEHIVGTKSYVLSLGSRQRKLVPVLSQI